MTERSLSASLVVVMCGRFSRRASVGLVLSVLTLGGCTGGDEGSDFVVSIDLRSSIEALGSDDLFTREPAELLLVALGERSIPALAAALEEDDAAVRLGALEVLASLGPAAMPRRVLDLAAGDPEIEVRAQAVSMLGSVSGDEARALVEEAVMEHEPLLQRAALAPCVQRCTSDRAFASLVDLVLLADSTVMMRVPRLVIRRILADEKRSSAMRHAVTKATTSVLSPDASPTTTERLRAGIVASDAGLAEAKPTLQAAIGREAGLWLRVEAVISLGEIGDADSVAPIDRLREEGPPALRAAACKALSSMAAREVDGAAEVAARCTSAGERFLGAPVP